MQRPDEEALYHALRVRQEYGLSDPATLRELVRACRREGVYKVVWTKTAEELDAHGVYVPWPEPIIILRKGAGRWVLAHELWHHITQKNAESGVTYAFTRRPHNAEEWGARMFSWLLNAHPRRKQGLEGWK